MIDLFSPFISQAMLFPSSPLQTHSLPFLYSIYMYISGYNPWLKEKSSYKSIIFLDDIDKIRMCIKKKKINVNRILRMTDSISYVSASGTNFSFGSLSLTNALQGKIQKGSKQTMIDNFEIFRTTPFIRVNAIPYDLHIFNKRKGVRLTITLP